MEMVYGAALLYATMVGTLLFRIFLNRASTPVWTYQFGVAETIALVATGLTATGVAWISDAALQNWNAATVAELSLAVGALALASIPTWKLLRRLAPQQLVFSRLDEERGQLIEFPTDRSDDPDDPESPSRQPRASGQSRQRAARQRAA